MYFSVVSKQFQTLFLVIIKKPSDRQKSLVLANYMLSFVKIATALGTENVGDRDPDHCVRS